MITQNAVGGGMDNQKHEGEARSGASVTCYVAVLECSCGNESVGDMWTETHVCTAETTIAELMGWKGNHPNGKRLSITQAT